MPESPSSPLVSYAGAESQRQTHWKTGAIVGGLLGGGLGFMAGYAMDNIVTDGRWSMGWGSIVGTVSGITAGAIVGGGLGWLVPR